MMTQDNILTTHQLSIGYDKRLPVSQDLNLTLYAGEFVCLLGPNGAGKSTLMRTLASMLEPLSGQVHLLGEDVRQTDARTLAQRLSIVLTDRVNAGLLTGYALVALGRHPYTDWTGTLSKHDEEMILWAVNAVGANDLAPRKITELSDGERQKLMIARALAQEPALMILDEPTAYLDLPRRVEIMQLLRQLAHDTDRAVLVSTHDLDLALRHADRIWLLPKGKPMQVGAPEDLVLSGAFEAAFHSEGVQFDKRTGSFVSTQTHLTDIAIIGDGLEAIWTIRALERVGYRIVDDAALTVTLKDSEWHLTDGADLSETGTTVYALITQLKSL